MHAAPRDFNGELVRAGQSSLGCIDMYACDRTSKVSSLVVATAVAASTGGVEAP